MIFISGVKVIKSYWNKLINLHLNIASFQDKPNFFKASAPWANAFYKSKCPCVCSLLRYRLNVFLPPLPEVEYPIFVEIRNPWGKVMERSGLRFEHFSIKVFLDNFSLQNKVETTLPDGLETSGQRANFGIFLDVFWVFAF